VTDLDTSFFWGKLLAGTKGSFRAFNAKAGRRMFCINGLADALAQ
jgi:hypothetical protein